MKVHVKEETTELLADRDAYVFWGDDPVYGRPLYYVHDYPPCHLAAALEGATLYRHDTGNSKTACCKVCHQRLMVPPTKIHDETNRS